MKLPRRTPFVFLGFFLAVCAFGQAPVHPRVALVFDDGPYEGSTEKFLALFAQEQIRVTFSHVGQNVTAHPELARAVAAGGHEIFNHSYSHPHFSTLDEASIRREVNDTQGALQTATGRAPRWFWSPYGDWDNRISVAVRSAGLEHFPTPSFNMISTGDWETGATVAQIYTRATRGVVDRTIISCHEWPPETLTALPDIIAELKRQGCVFVTAGELVGLTVSPEAVVSQTATAGHNVTLSVSGAVGSLQWQVSTDFGRTWTNLTNGSGYSEVTTNTLTINDATSAQNTALYLLTSIENGAVHYPSLIKLLVRPNFLPYPTAIVADGQDNLYVSDAGSDVVCAIKGDSVVTVFAGAAGHAGTADGSGPAARFNDPSGITAAADGRIIVSDTSNGTVRIIASNAAVSTIAGSVTTRGNADGPGAVATFSSPIGAAWSPGGDIFVADSMNHTIRRISSGGEVSTFAGSAGVSGSSDGAGSAARFNHPTGLAVDAGGNVYVADTNNNLVRKITLAGNVTTLAGLVGVSGTQDGSGADARFSHPGGLAVDAQGNVYVADTGNSTIRRITPDGVVSTVAGLPGVAGMKDGVGIEAWFNQPLAVCVASHGVLYVADTGNAIVRRIGVGAKVTTLDLASLESSEPAPPNPTTPTTPTTPSEPTPPTSANSGGGGASSPWLLGMLAALLAIRMSRRR